MKSLEDLDHRMGRSSNRGLNWLEAVLRSVEESVDGLSPFVARSSTKPVGISFRNRNVARARWRQTATMKKSTRNSSQRSNKDRPVEQPRALANGNAVLLGHFDPFFALSEPSTLEISNQRSHFRQLEDQLWAKSCQVGAIDLFEDETLVTLTALGLEQVAKTVSIHCVPGLPWGSNTV